MHDVHSTKRCLIAVATISYNIKQNSSFDLDFGDGIHSDYKSCEWGDTIGVLISPCPAGEFSGENGA
jgi:hypothetical protein